MGNCTGNNRVEKEMSIQSSMHDSDEYRICQNDPPLEVTVTSTNYECDEENFKMNLLRPLPCKIPILKHNFNRRVQMNPSKGDHKSMLLDRSLSSCIPMASTNADYSMSIPIICAGGDLNQKQLNEPVFDRNTSVINEVVNETALRHQRPKNILKNYIRENVDKVKSDNSKSKVVLPDVHPGRHSFIATKSVSIYNIDSKIRRPHSLSTDSEVTLNQSLLKNTYTADLPTPLVAVNEESSVLQDVSSLKLMLHKLKRYLTQDGYEGVTDAMNDCLLKLPPTPAVNVKSLSRDELEHEYELLCARNCKLERLLESREMMIVKLQGHKCLCGKVVYSSLEDRRKSENSQSLGLDNATYQSSNYKLPQGYK